MPTGVGNQAGQGSHRSGCVRPPAVRLVTPAELGTRPSSPQPLSCTGVAGPGLLRVRWQGVVTLSSKAQRVVLAQRRQDSWAEKAGPAHPVQSQSRCASAFPCHSPPLLHGHEKTEPFAPGPTTVPSMSSM